jgi:hypothetical protein
LTDAKIFTKIDIRGAYNFVRIRPGDKWKTSFVCHLGQFESTVMSFGLLKTAPAIFQFMMEDFFLIYLDDILIYSVSEDEHKKHDLEVLRRLQNNRLLAKLEKSHFNCKFVEFLGYVISDVSVSVAAKKAEVIRNWPVPTRRRELKSFLGTANYNRKFIHGYSRIAAPLLALDTKEVVTKKFSDCWNEECSRAFERLKEAITSAPALRHVYFNFPFVLETDASDFALGAVLLQPENLDSKVLHSVSFASRKLMKAERNYSTYDKELLGLIFAFGKWHQFLYGSLYPVAIRLNTSDVEILEVGKRLEVLKARHSNLAAGHFGIQRTYEAIRKDFYWPSMRKDVEEFVNSCIICQKIKSSRQKVFGKLMPPVPSGPWKSLGMDFVVKLPNSNGYDSILVVVDRFSKMCHLIPCKKSIDAIETADLFLRNIVKHHGIPFDIVSDRGSQFVSKFWSELCRRIGIERKLSTAAHPQTDGQTERTNQTFEQYLRAFVNYRQDDWSELLHFAEMAMNNAVNRSSKRSPFEINYGFSPNFDFLAVNKNNVVPTVDTFMNNLRGIWTETVKNLKNTAIIMKKDSVREEKQTLKLANMFYWILNI